MEEFPEIFEGDGDILAGLDQSFDPLPSGLGVLGNWDDLDSKPMDLDRAAAAPIMPPPAPMEIDDEGERDEMDNKEHREEDAEDAEDQRELPDVAKTEDEKEYTASEPESLEDDTSEALEDSRSLYVALPVPSIDISEYIEPECPKDRVSDILSAKERQGERLYTIEFRDGTVNNNVSEEQIRSYPRGGKTLKRFMRDQEAIKLSQKPDDDYSDYSDRGPDRRAKRRRVSHKQSIFNYSIKLGRDDSDSDIPVSEFTGSSRSRSTRSGGRVLRSRNQPSKAAESSNSLPLHDDDETDELARDDSGDGDNYVPVVKSDIKPRGRGRLAWKKHARRASSKQDRDSSLEFEAPRRSGRTNKNTKNMQDNLDDDYEEYRSPAPVGIQKVISMKEVYMTTPQSFRDFHTHGCDTCSRYGNNSQKGPLVFCQGCSLAFHKNCLGFRNAREHIVTKVGEAEFVLQCRFCVLVYKNKDAASPYHDMCQGCRQKGVSCKAFSHKINSRQEEKIRIANGGTDPCIKVNPKLLNNSANLLFRCTTCHRGFHFKCLPPRWAKSGRDERSDLDAKRKARLSEYSSEWKCKECAESVNKIESIVAWRPTNRDAYKPEMTCLDFDEDSKEYLIKWNKRSHYHCEWHPGAWVFGVTGGIMRGSFAKRNAGENLEPKFNEKEAIPEEYLLIDIVLRVKYNVGDGLSSSKEDDIEKIDNVANIMVKFQGLGYDNVVWDAPPTRDSGPFWHAFEVAYLEYLNGKHFKNEGQKTISGRINKFRKAPFQTLSSQPPGLVRGQLMEYQLEGVDWLRYNYHREHSVILADEMGLGKTIQVIGLITSLVQQTPRSFPFLIVVPNSTCPNWRREFRQWAPDVRIVSYHGGREPQELIYNHELFPERRGPMKAYVVVMSYDSAQDDRTRTLFKHIQWAGLVVDEGQRLKNDRNILYNALRSMRIPWRLLLTGTPLQNNKRELFNLLQFIDPSKDAASLDEEYSELTAENIPKLHEMIRPYFLRRTKTQVLKFLPPMAQIIVPVTMTYLQEKLCKSIMAKNPVLIKSIFAKGRIKAGERGSLNNILMQLRKCLCHPFVYSKAIEEKNVDNETLQRNLVEASPKLILLDLMLPKLIEQGHRVLMFSQFLDNLDVIEDHLTGAGYQFQRLDGSISSLEKQKRIDSFNAPDSPYSIFLLSTRAGGVGINLATADTVIILDPDFNPHQDIQALSRAHRIGQKNKVLCIQMVTKNSVEEKVMQMGRKKLALDHALIESMEDKEVSGNDLESVLQHGAEALFSDKEQDKIQYDDAAIEKLLDRTTIVDKEDSNADHENQFAFARVWEHDKGELTDVANLPDPGESDLNPSIWERILEQREEDARMEAEESKQVLGRGERRRQAVMYTGDVNGDVNGDGEAAAANSSDLDEDFIDKDASDLSDEEEEESDAEANNMAGGSQGFQPNISNRVPTGTGTGTTAPPAAFHLPQTATPATPATPAVPGPFVHPAPQDQSQASHKRQRSRVEGEAQAKRGRPSTVVVSLDAGPSQTPGSRSQRPSPAVKQMQAGAHIPAVGATCLRCKVYHDDIRKCPVFMNGIRGPSLPIACERCGMAHYGGDAQCPMLNNNVPGRVVPVLNSQRRPAANSIDNSVWSPGLEPTPRLISTAGIVGNSEIALRIQLDSLRRQQRVNLDNRNRQNGQNGRNGHSLGHDSGSPGLPIDGHSNANANSINRNGDSSSRVDNMQPNDPNTNTNADANTREILQARLWDLYYNNGPRRTG